MFEYGISEEPKENGGKKIQDDETKLYKRDMCVYA